MAAFSAQSVNDREDQGLTLPPDPAGSLAPARSVKGGIKSGSHGEG